MIWPGSGASNADIVVAEVVGKPVYRAQVESAWVRFPEQDRPTRAQVLDILIARQILAHEAHQRGLANHPRVVERLAYSQQQRAIELLLEREVDNKVAVDEAQIQALFNEQGYGTKRKVRGRQIVVDTPQMADSLYRLVRDGADMAALAQRYSMEQQSAPRGGDLNFWDETMMVGEVPSRLFSLEVGQLAPPFKVGKYYHIIRAEEAVPITYQDLRSRLEKRLYDSRHHARRGAFNQELTQRYQLQTEGETLLYLVQLNKTSAHGMPQLGPDAELDRVMLRYKGGAVSLKRYLRWVEFTPPNKRPVAVDTASMGLFARRTAIDSVLLGIEAKRQGMLQGEALAQFKRRRLEELMIEELRFQTAEEPLVNEQVLRAYFNEQLERYTDPPLIYYEAILVHLKQEGLDVAQRLKKGEELWSLAQGFPRFHGEWRQYGIFHTEHEGTVKSEFPQVIEAVRQSQIGDIGGPFMVSFQRQKGQVWNGYMVFRVLEHRPAQVIPFEDPIVQRELKKLVAAPLKSQIEASFDRFLRGLQQSYQDRIKIYNERL